MLRDKVTLEEALKGLIVNNTDKELWLALKENIPAAFKQSKDVVSANLNAIPIARPLAQFRRYSVDNALANICSTGVSSEICYAPNDGEIYILMKSGKLTISHVIINPDSRGPKRAKHRDNISQKNQFLSFHQYQMFEQSDPANIDDIETLHLAIIIVSPSKNSEDQDMPAEIYITIPYFSNWSICHLKMTLTETIRSYENKPADVYDGAWGVLKKRLQQEEDNTG